MPYRYSDSDYLNMVMCYHEANYSLVEAVRLFHERHGVRVCPRTILGAEQRFRESGRFMPSGDAGRPRTSVQLEEDVLNFFELHPTASTRDAAAVFNTNHVYVWKVLKRERRHPYHFTRVQELMPQDYAPRVEFCQWIRRNSLANILWTDECTFTRVGMFNIHNAHYWSEENPHLARPDHFQTRFSVNVWAGLLGHQLIGPVFFNRLNGAVYLEFLERELEELLEDVPLNLMQQMHYQHDGAPAHYDRHVREYLTARFQDRWIGRGGPIAWPARSPDLTPLDFHVWGRAKDLVYGQDGHTITSAEQLKARIISAFETMRGDSESLVRVHRHILKRAALCIQENGGHFQQLL